MQENFYSYQRRRLSLLMGWGLLSIVVGLFTQLIPRAFWRQFGLQSLLWGAIDAALAFFGLRGADYKEKHLMQGELDSSDQQKEARNFHRILVINTCLDIGYIMSGVWIVQRFRKQSDRRGMGMGIVVQGVWLFLFDGLLAREVAYWRQVYERNRR